MEHAFPPRASTAICPSAIATGSGNPVCEQHSTTFCSGCRTRSAKTSIRHDGRDFTCQRLTANSELALQRPKATELLATVGALAETTDTARTTGTGLGLAIVDTLSQRNA